MLPPGYTCVLRTDVRLAQRWDQALTRLGLEVAVAVDADGAWEIGVAERHAERARALVEAVDAGRAELPGGPVIRSTGFKALAAVAVLLAVVLVVILLVWGR